MPASNHFTPTRQCEPNSFLRWANNESAVYSIIHVLDSDRSALMKLTGQELRDLWHGLIGKRMGLTGHGGTGPRKEGLVDSIIAVATEQTLRGAPWCCREEDITQEDRDAPMPPHKPTAAERQLYAELAARSAEIKRQRETLPSVDRA